MDRARGGPNKTAASVTSIEKFEKGFTIEKSFSISGWSQTVWTSEPGSSISDSKMNSLMKFDPWMPNPNLIPSMANSEHWTVMSNEQCSPYNITRWIVVSTLVESWKVQCEVMTCEWYTLTPLLSPSLLPRSWYTLRIRANLGVCNLVVHKP